MVTRVELQEWLERFPPDTEIEFKDGLGEYIPLNLDSHDWGEGSDCGDQWDFIDFRKHGVARTSKNKGRCFLIFGYD